MENKLKHLEFLQNVISRMNSNSFLMKGWCVSIIAAIFVLSSKDIKNVYFLVALIPAIAFWIVDGFFISTERKFRRLYEDVIKLNETQIDFSMDVSKISNKKKTSWVEGILSKTLVPFYGFLIIGIVTFFLISKTS